MPGIEVHRSGDLKLRPDVPGARLWAVALERALLTYFELEPHTQFPEHSHEAEQITLVLEGELIFIFNGGETTLRSGDVIAIPSGAVHAARTGGKPCRAVDAWSPVRRDLL